MSHAYMVRITHSYQDASGVVALWSQRCSKMVVYEHTGSLTEKVHIHMVIVGSDTHKKQLRNIAQATGLMLTGNKFCSFKEFKGEERCMIYMTKGKHDPSFIKGFTPDEAAYWRSLWVDDEKKSSDQVLYDKTFGSTTQERMYELWKQAHTELVEMHEKNYVPAKFIYAKTVAKQAAFKANNNIWNMRTTNQYKMLVYTYCFRNGVRIPDKDPVFKQI